MQHLPILKICSCPCQAGPKSRLLKAQPGEQGNAEGRHRCQGHRHHSAHPQQKSGGGDGLEILLPTLSLYMP